MRTPTFTHRLPVIGVAVGLVAASLGAAPLISQAQAAECQAWNTTSGSAVSVDLQAVIDTAAAGDTIHVTGTCTGGFTLDKDLKVSRDPDRRRPTLDGAGAATVLTVIGTAEAPVTVVLNGLHITGGSAERGGGLRSVYGYVRLIDSLVSGNLAREDGGGIFSRGRLTLVDTRVTANMAPGLGGGIFSRGGLRLTGETTIIENLGAGIWTVGTVELVGGSEVVRNTGGGISASRTCRVTMNGSSAVRGNQEWGGIGYCRRVVMNDRSSVTRNHGKQHGGVLGLVIMNDRAVVAGNTSRQYGGGVYGRVVMNGHARIVRNTARLSGGGIFSGPVRMNGHAVIASNTALEGGGIYTEWAGVILHDQASITRNVAKDTGGGVLSWTDCPEMLGPVVTRDRATIHRNLPNNIVKQVLGCAGEM